MYVALTLLCFAYLLFFTLLVINKLNNIVSILEEHFEGGDEDGEDKRTV